MPVSEELLEKIVEEINGGVRLRVYVKPGSNKTALVVEEDELVFYTDEPPVQGRANASLKKFIAKAVGVNTSRVEIVRGLKDRVKTIVIRDVSKDRVVKALASVAEPW